jgi:hypothetical protein
MNLKSDNEKLTFIVDTLCTIDFKHKGGSYAIHKLAFELAKKGNYVYVFNEPTYPHPNIEIIPTIKVSHDDGWWGNYSWEPFSYNPSRTVSVYTQITWGNPFNTIYNTRWFLDNYESDKWDSYKDDVIYNYGSFEIPNGVSQKNLTVFDYNFDKYYNTNNLNRKGFGYLFHKNTPDWGLDFVDKFGATKIPHFNGKENLDYLLDEFNKYEYVLTFDDKSYYTTAAALCGTKAIILNPNKNLTPNEYRQLNPIQMCGVAYGMNDIKWANETIGLVRNNLLELEKKDKQTINNFIEFWKNKLV